MMEKLIDDIKVYLQEKFNLEKNKLLDDNGLTIELPDITEIYTYEPIAVQKYPCLVIEGFSNDLDLRNISNFNERVQYTNLNIVRIMVMHINNSRGDILDRQIYRYVKTLVNMFSNVEAFYFDNSYRCMIRKPIQYINPISKTASYFKMAVLELEFENIY